MSGNGTFNGFPGLARGTVIPNLFFATVLPALREPCDLLAFLWVSRIVQELRGEVRCVGAQQIWVYDGAAPSFEALGGGRAGLDRGLDRCVEAGALLELRLSGPGDVRVFFVNNPASQRAVGRARAGELEVRPGTVATAPPALEARPGIFRLYEENIGTITPIVGERLLEAVEQYPSEWIDDAFREAAELNKRSWRYIERILQNWAQEGRGHETAGRNTFEERKRRYLG